MQHSAISCVSQHLNLLFYQDSNHMMNKRRSKRDDDSSDYTKKEVFASPVMPSTIAINNELQKAMETVLLTRDRAKHLHSMWRNHLRKLSFLVSFLSMYQIQQPVIECITNLKNKTYTLSSFEALYIIAGENMCEIVNLFICLLLLYFLSINNTIGTLSHWSYIVASSFTPLCIGLFYHSTLVVGCLDTNIPYHDNSRKRQFPVSALFHVIITGCYWFMNIEREKYEGHVEMVKKLQVDLSDKKCHGVKDPQSENK